MQQDPRIELALQLVRQCASRALDPAETMPVLQEMLAGLPESTLPELRQALGATAASPAVKALLASIDLRLLAQAAQAHASLAVGSFRPAEWPHLRHLPVPSQAGWLDHEALLTLAAEVCAIRRDLAQISQLPEACPKLEKVVATAYAGKLAAFRGQAARWQVFSLARLANEPAPDDLSKALLGLASGAGVVSAPGTPQDLAQAYRIAQEPDEAHRLLNQLLTWPGSEAAEVLADLSFRSPADRRHAIEALMLRFGQRDLRHWENWRRFLQHATEKRRAAVAAEGRILAQCRAELCLLWCEENCPDPSAELRAALEERVARRATSAEPERLALTWRQALDPDEAQRLPGASLRPPVPRPPPLPPGIGGGRPTQAEARAPGRRAAAATPVRAQAPLPSPVSAPLRASAAAAGGSPRVATPAAPVAPEEPPPPSVWQEHVQPLLLEYWYLVAGLVLMIAGASLLAYLTWDKSPLWRYTVMPGALLVFTVSLAELGAWLARRGEELRGTGAMLHGGAIALLPVNVMVVAVVSRGQVSVALTLVLTVVYLVVVGIGLRRWCGQLLPAMRGDLAAPLLLANALIPLAALLAQAGPADTVVPATTAGFYFAVIAAAVGSRRFLNRLAPTPEPERLFLWFFGVALAVTLAEVFLWVHLFLGLLPVVHLYGLLFIFIGGEVFFAERRTAQLRGQGEAYTGESFLGFALILAGLLMGIGNDSARVVCFAAAGIVWLLQAQRREGLGNHWIAVSLLLVAGAAIGFLPWFPRSAELNLLPALGLGLALSLGAARALARGRDERLVLCVIDLQPGVLLLTAAVTIFMQWRLRSAPIPAGVTLALVAVVLACRAFRLQRLSWLHSAMALLVLALPYFGCIDMVKHDARGNTMAFGLGVLSLAWLALLTAWRQPFLRQARSTVVFSYGLLALAAMVLRVFLEATPLEGACDYSGPFLAALALALAAWHTRSLLPGFAAATILAVLFPELRTRFREAFDLVGWGSGLGGASCALLLLGLCFGLRRWPRLAHVEGGDLWADQNPFPWRRTDYTLITTPLVATALFLCAKTCTLTSLRGLAAETVGAKTVAALGIDAVTWTAAAIYLRRYSLACVLPHLGWLSLLGAFLLGQHLSAPGLSRATVQFPLLWTGLCLQAAWAVYRLLGFRHDWLGGLLAEPTRRVLGGGALILGWLLAVWLVAERSLVTSQYLAGFIALQLVWQGLRQRTYSYGVMLFALLTTVLYALPRHPGVTHLEVSQLFLHLLIAVQVGLGVLEVRESWHERLRPLSRPFLAGATLLALVLAGQAWIGLTLGWDPPPFDLTQHVLLVMVLLATARANAAALIALVAAAVVYALLDVHEPRHLALFGLSLAAIPFAVRPLQRWFPRIVEGRYPLLRDTVPPSLWWLTASLLAGLWATAEQYVWTYDQARLAPVWQTTIAPWATVLSFALAGLYRRASWLWVPGGILLAVANVHAVNQWWGTALLGYGLSPLHIVCLGLAATLVETAILRVAGRRTAFASLVGAGGKVMAGLILALLAANYVLHRDLAAMGSERLVVSGLMALAAGLYFRLLVAIEQDISPLERRWLTSFYHLGVTVAIWCLCLLIPALRSSQFALVALAMAPLYFALQAELGRPEKRLGYAHSAEALAFMILALYAGNAAFQMIAFPGSTLSRDPYHLQAPVAIGLGAVLLRLHALTRGAWTAFYGGLALIVGLFFAVTAWPGLSPFGYPMPAGWAAVVLAHLLIVASQRRSPLRAWIQELAGIDDLTWDDLRRAWGRWVLAGAQLVILLAVLDYRHDSRHVTPLLLAAASVFIHQGILGRRPWYLAAGVLEVLLALHADFLLPRGYAGLLPADAVIWVILGLWATLVVPWDLWRRWLRADHAEAIVVGLCLLAFAHVWYHGPASAVGIAGVACMAGLGLLTPRTTRRPDTTGETQCAALVLAAPLWLAYCQQLYVTGDWLVGFRALLAMAVASLAVGAGARWCRQRTGRYLDQAAIPQPRLFHHTLAYLDTHGGAVNTALLWLTTALLGALLFRVYLPMPLPVEGVMIVLGVAWAALALAWRGEALDRSQVHAGFLTEFAICGAAAVVRRMLAAMGFWDPHYDVWVSLAVSTGLSGAKTYVHGRSAPARLPLVVSLFALPAAVLGWVAFQGLGTDVALLVIGLHGVSFLWLGMGERHSSYNAMAVMHFVAFLVLLFWSRLELRFLHVYTIPVGLGVLVLLQLHGDRMAAAARNAVRLVVLLSMLGSCGYYVLTDRGYALGFHATMLLLCIGAMALGGVLRVRLYLALGLAGLLLDVAVLGTRVIGHLDSAQQKMSIAILLLALGGALVGGTAYAKAQREVLAARLASWRGRLAAWE